MIQALLNGWAWSGYIMFDYGATLYKPDTRFWRKDYSGTVYGPTTYYYDKFRQNPMTLVVGVCQNHLIKECGYH